MSEESEKKENRRSELLSNPRAVRAFCWIALHRRLCLLLLAGVLAACMAAIYFLAPDMDSAVLTGVVILAMSAGILAYQGIKKAPVLAMNGLIRQEQPKGGQGDWEKLLAFADALEKRLPTLERKQLAFTLLTFRDAALHWLKRYDEAEAMLRGFDQCWDQSMRDYIEDRLAVSRALRSLDQAKALAEQGNYDEAIALLQGTPDDGRGPAKKVLAGAIAHFNAKKTQAEE